MRTSPGIERANETNSAVENSLPAKEVADQYGFRDFSSLAIERRRADGRMRALEALRSIFMPMI